MHTLHVTLLRSSLLLSLCSLALLPACDPGGDGDEGTDAGDTGDGDGDGDCTLLEQEDVDVDTTLPAGCYTTETLLSIDGTTLTLDAGVSIRFGEFAGVSVFGTGTLQANGAADDVVEMRGSSGSWMGLSVFGGSATLANVELSGAGATDNPAVTVGGDGNATISGSLIDGNEGPALGVDALSTLTLESTTVSNNASIGTVGFPTLESIGADNVFTDNGDDILGVSGSSIEANLSVPAHGVPLLVESGAVTVTADVTLSPGVEMRFTQDARLRVAPEGTLNAVGTTDSPIVLRGELEERGYWQGIAFESKSSSNVLEYVELAHGGASQWNGYGDSTGSIWITEEGKLRVTNSTLRESGWYALIANSGADIEGFANNSIEDNERAINVWGDAAAMVEASNSFTNNEDENVVRVGIASQTSVDSAGAWDALEVPYFISTRMFVYNDLSFEAGADIAVAQDVEILVYPEGTLAMNGTGTDPVVVRGLEDLSGYWKGINYGSTSVNNQIVNAELRNAGSSDWYGGGDAFATIYVGGFIGNATLTLDDATIAKGDGYAIIVDDESSVTCSATFDNVEKGILGSGSC